MKSRVAAHYEYGPFGEPLAVTGAVAAEMPFRFSTKYQDSETGLYYYGYRYYDPITGRWLSRDPIGERGGANLFGYVGNNPVLKIDPFGLFDPATGTAYDLFNEWANGTTPDQVNFRDGDRMAEQIKGSKEVGLAVSEIMFQLQYKQCGAAIGPIRVVRSLGNQTFSQHLGYPFGFVGDAYHNPARAFLGSFDGTATLVYVDCCKGIGRVEVHLWDNPRLGSATHVPTPWGYKELADDVNGPPGTPFRSFRVDFLFHIRLAFIPRDEDRKNGIHIFLPPGLPMF